ncbi:MAG: J domain-containing protein [Bacteroidota bacterium]|nr:J domain-containing protein [Bacteroidota bacterium]
MEYKDYYKILGLNKSATDNDIKKAYRKLARKYHPDLNPNDKVSENKFKEINEANEVLSNTDNRKKYDKYGKDWKHADEIEKANQGQTFRKRSQQGATGGFSGHDENDFSDFFESMFGGGSSRTRDNNIKFRGQDINAELHLDLKDVFTTHKRTVTVHGNNIRLTIPAGVKNGQVLKIKGHGGEGLNGGPKGDLYITFSIENHSKFKLDNAHLYTTVELDLYKAILGGDITIDIFDGKVKLKVKPETKNNTKVKLKGKGFPVYNKEGEFGDLYITYQINIPTNLTEKEKELFTDLSKLRMS